MSMTLNQLIHRHARYRGERPAVVFGDQRLNWRQLEHRVNQLANALQRSGIKKGDAVATVLPNCLELLTLYWAVTSIGAVVVPVSPLLQPRGLVNLLQDSQSCMVFLKPTAFTALTEFRDELPLIADDGFVVVGATTESGGIDYPGFVKGTADTPPQAVDVMPDDLFNIVYSSGTTGMPKGIEHTHQIRFLYGSLFANSFRMRPESVVLQTGSIVFNGAFVTMMPTFFQGATYILHQAFDTEEMIRTIEREQVTHAMMVPAQIAAVLESPNCTAESLQSLEMILTLGAPLDQSYKERMNALAPGCFYELYGLTEGFVTILDKTDFDAHPGSVGCPPPGYEIRITDEQGNRLPAGEVGEIVGRGPILMRGYFGRQDLTRVAIRDGWLYTGDLGYLDEEGFLYLSGRKKEMIISGGVNVFPVDIEAVALSHPEVAQAAVFGIESARWGESPVAALILRENSAADGEAIREWINERVEAKYQRVSDVMVCEQFPQNVAGKVLKHELKERYLED